MAAAVEQHGGRIFTSTHVTGIEGDRPLVIRTANGSAVTARFAVVATNTPIHERIAIHTKQIAYRTYAIALEVAPESVPRALYWDTADPYHYVRVRRGPDSRSDLLLVGGEDHRVGERNAEGDLRYARLERWARTQFKALGPVVYRWSGQVMEPLDGLAFIGRTPSGPSSVFLATGDSGMGLTHGTIAGILLCDAIEGREHPWAELYSPSRKPLAAVGAYLRENGRTAAHYADWLHRGAEIDAIPRDSGAIVQQGARKLAVFRDEQGELHVRSAMCTHLGGLVGWNVTERTWDCPCHGARYDRFGRVVHGPANSDLSPEALPDKRA